MKSKIDPRHTARKVALSSLFCWLFTEPRADECNLLARELLEISEDAQNQELTDFLVNGVKENLKNKPYDANFYHHLKYILKRFTPQDRERAEREANQSESD